MGIVTPALAGTPADAWRLVFALEAALILFAILLRLPALWTPGNEANYDLVDHLRYVDWYAEHLLPPPLDHSRVTYGPPLYYFLCGLLRRMGVSHGGLAVVSFVLALARLGLLWWGLRAFVRSGIARVGALAIASVLPAAVHIDGMINNESLSILLCSAALLCALRAHHAEGSARWRGALLAGVFCGLALLTKFSALMLVFAMGVGAVLDAVWSGGGPRTWARRLAPWIATLGMTTLIAGPWYVRNARLHQRSFPTAFHTHDWWAVPEPLRDVPLWQKRPLVYFYGFNEKTLGYPFFPGDWANDGARFASNMVATAFADYYNFQFARPPSKPEEQDGHNARLSKRTVALARVSVWAGIAITGVTVIASLAWLLWALRRRRADVVMLLCATGLAVAGQAYFATQYPADSYGVVKATYLQFAAAPMFAAFGLALAWLSRWRLAWPVVIALGLAVVAVAVYTTDARGSWF